MRVFNIIFLVLFVLFAALQYNDPDPYLWIPIYLYGALICLLWLLKKQKTVLIWIGIIAYLAYAGYLFVADDGVLSWINDHNAENIAATMKAERPWIEDSREFFGLLILIVVLVIDLRKKPV
ncbi:MAG: transmembrane 220 family protein [Flavitalea sp.]